MIRFKPIGILEQFKNLLSVPQLHTMFCVPHAIYDKCLVCSEAVLCNLSSFMTNYSFPARHHIC